MSNQYGYGSGGGHSASSGPNFRWWIPADGIRRDVIQADIQRYLGPEAVVRPGEGRDNDRGRSGYWIAAYRTLTPAMVQDLRADSANFERSGDTGRYENSMVHRSRQHWGPSDPSTTSSERQQPSRPEPEPAYTRPAENYGSSQQYGGGQQSYAGGYGAQYDRPQRAQPEPRYQEPSRDQYPPGYGGAQPGGYGSQQISPASDYTYAASSHGSSVSGSQYGYSEPQYSRGSTQDHSAAPRSHVPSQYPGNSGAGSSQYSQPPSNTHTPTSRPPPGYYLASDGRFYPESSKPSAT